MDLAVAITGVAGPGGGTEAKPVGLVHLACARRGLGTLHYRRLFKGTRASVQRQAVALALAMLRRQARAAR